MIATQGLPAFLLVIALLALTIAFVIHEVRRTGANPPVKPTQRR